MVTDGFAVGCCAVILRLCFTPKIGTVLGMSTRGI